MITQVSYDNGLVNIYILKAMADMTSFWNTLQQCGYKVQMYTRVVYNTGVFPRLSKLLQTYFNHIKDFSRKVAQSCYSLGKTLIAQNYTRTCNYIVSWPWSDIPLYCENDAQWSIQSISVASPTTDIYIPLLRIMATIRTCVLRRYDISSNSPSGGIKEIVRSFSNLDKRTHWWNLTSSRSIPLLGFPNNKF